jgi:hypothetical protein
MLVALKSIPTSLAIKPRQRAVKIINLIIGAQLEDLAEFESFIVMLVSVPDSAATAGTTNQSSEDYSGRSPAAMINRRCFFCHYEIG